LIVYLNQFFILLTILPNPPKNDLSFCQNVFFSGWISGSGAGADQKLTISYHNYFEPVIRRYPAIVAEYNRLELDKKPLNKAKTARLEAVITQWRDVIEDVRTAVRKLNCYIPILNSPFVSNHAH